MRRFYMTGLVAFTAMALAAGTASALRVAIMPAFTTQQKAIQSEAVVIGKVSSIEKDEVEAEPFLGAKNKIPYKIAVIKIDSIVSGVKGITHIKVGFPSQAGGGDAPVPDVKPLPAPGRPIRPPFVGPIELKQDQEGVFFLHKHPSADFFIIQNLFAPLDAKADNYKDELAKVKAIAAAVADPLKALKAEKAEDRLSAAAILVQKYRSYPPNAQFGAEEVAIPAEQSQLILKTLIEADWDKYANDQILSPMNAISMLGLYQGSNGIPQYKPLANDPNPGESYRKWFKEEISKWYTKSGEKFEIKKFVAKTKQ